MQIHVHGYFAAVGIFIRKLFVYFPRSDSVIRNFMIVIMSRAKDLMEDRSYFVDAECRISFYTRRYSHLRNCHFDWSKTWNKKMH